MSARRTRLSSKGFFSWFIATSSRQSQGLSCTVIFVPERLHELSRSAGLKPRNWIVGPLAADRRHLRRRGR